jgi:mono/diheme cytochrome c family protein
MRTHHTSSRTTSIITASAICLITVASMAAGDRAPDAQRQQAPSILLDSVDGGDSFQRYCATCHGRSGKGDGQVAAALKSKPSDLTQLARRNDGLYPADRVRAIVSGYGAALPAHGPGEMPVWGPIFRALDPSDVRVAIRIDNIVEYVGKLQEPSSGTSSLGAQLFRTHCAACHGTDARGTGTATSALRRQPPDLTEYTARNGGVFPRERVYQIIDGRYVPAHGDRDMPIWGDAFSRSREGLSDAAVKARIDAIVTYLEAIQRRSAE